MRGHQNAKKLRGKAEKGGGPMVTQRGQKGLSAGGGKPERVAVGEKIGRPR